MRQEMEKILKPLRLEAKQGFANRSVTGGLDRYLSSAFADLARRAAAAVGPGPWVALHGGLERLRRDFTQYLTLDGEGRRELVVRAVAALESWLADPGVHSIRQDPAEAGRTPSAESPDDRALHASILPFVPADKKRAFERLGLRTLADLLSYTPKWVVHRSLLTPISRTGEGREPVFLKACINGISRSRRGPRETVKVILEDPSGRLAWIWFNRPYMNKELMNGRRVLLHDAPESSRWGKQVVGETGRYEFLAPEEEEALEGGKTLVFYPATPTLDQAFWRGLFAQVLDAALPSVEDVLSPRMTPPVLGLSEAIRRIHRPDDPAAYEQGRRRLALDELTFLQMYLLVKRKLIESRKKGRTYLFEGPRILNFRQQIPFKLTKAQRRVLAEIRQDLGRPYPMNRLLQGDVGSGKTVVAAIAFLYAADSGVQGALMAPTEILAAQHHATLDSMVGPGGLRCVLLTGDLKASERRAALKAIEQGEADVAVGTHALLEEGVRFRDLGIMVLDERHKFGVLQRAALERKGRFPDSLMMTATPFPRALVLTEYGDTDLSILDEMPQGRRPVKTVWRGEGHKEEVYQFVRERVLAGEQAFIVYPVVEESKTFLRSATQMYRLFKDRTFHGFKVGLLHGRMKKEEKADIMRCFRGREVQILVSTTVVEVGVDVSNATVMVVEHAERFGLAQLHQLRGRVGRGTAQAYCYLLTSGSISASAVERVRTMTSTNDGFELSEMDLSIRGPGDIFGVSQAGRREGGVVDLKRDGPLVEEARTSAQKILADDPLLEDPKNADLRRHFAERYKQELDLAALS